MSQRNHPKDKHDNGDGEAAATGAKSGGDARDGDGFASADHFRAAGVVAAARGEEVKPSPTSLQQQ